MIIKSILFIFWTLLTYMVGFWAGEDFITKHKWETIFGEYPVGISQWMNHGKKYGYDKYWLEKQKGIDAIKRTAKKLDEK